jgi:cytoskeletal protein CcmA (bactofilin family)
MLKRKKTPVRNTETSGSSSPSITIITESTKMNADLNSEDGIRIAGMVEGEVESKKKIIISESGKIKGSIVTPIADIAGTINGDIYTNNKLTLRPTAVVHGKIFAKKIAIEDGAQLSGAFNVGPDTEISKLNGSSTSQKGSKKPSLEKKED